MAAGSGLGRLVGRARRRHDRPSAVDRGDGPMRGGTRASTTGSRLDEIVERDAFGAGLGHRGEGQRGAGDGGGASAAGMSRPARASWPWTLTSVRAGRCGARRAAAGSTRSSSAGHAEEVGVDARARGRRPASGGRCAGGRPARRRGGGGPAVGGRGGGGSRRPRVSAPMAAEVGGGHAVDGDHQRAASAGACRRGDAREQQRLAEAVAQRLEPEVLLERGRAARGRTRPRGRGRRRRPSGARRVVIGRACSRHDRAVVVDGPLEVLRAAVGCAGRGGEPGQAAEGGGRRAG